MSTLKTIRITICADCLDGIGETCKTPGCALLSHRVDLAIDPSSYDVIESRIHPTCKYFVLNFLIKAGMSMAQKQYEGSGDISPEIEATARNIWDSGKARRAGDGWTSNQEARAIA